MSEVRLGPIRFGWCTECNIPILDARRECSRCGSKPMRVGVTPPGDVRPAFEHDLRLLRQLADEHFGHGCGHLLFPTDKLVVLNKAPSLDRMDEVFVDGRALSTLRFDVGKGYRLMLRMEGARRIQDKVSRNWIMVSDDAALYIIDGASAMVPGIMRVDERITKGDEVIVLDCNHRAIAVGSARMDGTEMVSREKGAATKTRWSSEPREAALLEGGQTWTDAIESNRAEMDQRIGSSVGFVKRAVERHQLPLAVSFSGGKDSLATLLLVLKAGYRPKVLFVDTGLELPETSEYVHEFIAELGLELVVEHVGERFWENLGTFGPPSKDFRWCCKSCKLGPTTRLIKNQFPDGVLNFIGQRRYESRTRAQKGSVWRNPWVPGQVGASPVQNWTSLHVWLYIFMKKAEYNPWYERGLERIGCFLCPSSDMAELSLVEEGYEGYMRWSEFLHGYAREQGFGNEWQSLGLWRWRSPPGELRKYLKRAESRKEETVLELSFVEGYSPCSEGLSAEGMFNSRLDLDSVANTMNILDKVERDDEIRACSADSILIFEEGAVVVKGADESELKSKKSALERLVRKSMLCVGCGTCLGLCKEDAIRIEHGRSWIDESLCIHCGACMAPCPAVEFSGEFRF